MVPNSNWMHFVIKIYLYNFKHEPIIVTKKIFENFNNSDAKPVLALYLLQLKSIKDLMNKVP